jgi:hypothetical protein
MKPPRFHRRDQACGCRGFDLHKTDASKRRSEIIVSELQSEVETSDAGTDAEAVDGIASRGR